MKWAALLFVPMILIACNEVAEFPTRPRVTTEPLVPIAELRAAPTRVELGGKKLTLDTYVWRDFMPISPPDGKPMIASVRVITADSSAVPRGLAAVALWVVHGDQVWETPFTDEPRGEQPPYQIERVARNGPKWEPGVQVDVVVAVRVGDGPSSLLRAPNQTIQATH